MIILITILVLREHPLGDKWDVVVRKVNAFDAEAILRNNMLMFEEVKTSLDWATTNNFALIHPNLGFLQNNDHKKRNSGLTSKRPAVLFSSFSSLEREWKITGTLSIQHYWKMIPCIDHNISCMEYCNLLWLRLISCRLTSVLKAPDS